MPGGREQSWEDKFKIQRAAVEALQEAAEAVLTAEFQGLYYSLAIFPKLIRLIN
jgi:hypothetical protein